MKDGQLFISAVLTELNRRKVLRTVGAYAVAVFVVLQLMDAAVEPLRLPDWLPTLLVIVLILGFPHWCLCWPGCSISRPRASKKPAVHDC